MGHGEARLAAEFAEEKVAQRVERFLAELWGIIGKRDDINVRVNGGCVEAEVEDLHFAALEVPSRKMPGDRTFVTLLGRCPMCGAEIMSEPIYSLAGLGKMLNKFQPIEAHYCIA